MNTAIRILGQRFMGKIDLCFDCFRANGFSALDCKPIHRTDVKDVGHAKCDYCHKLLVTQWVGEEVYGTSRIRYPWLFE